MEEEPRSFVELHQARTLLRAPCLSRKSVHTMTSDAPSSRSQTQSLPESAVILGPPSPQTPSTPSTPTSSFKVGVSPLSSKVTTVLSASYADSEFREALGQLDERCVQNTPETRRELRLRLQNEVINSNGDIIDEFGKVAEVWDVTRAR